MTMEQLIEREKEALSRLRVLEGERKALSDELKEIAEARYAEERKSTAGGTVGNTAANRGITAILREERRQRVKEMFLSDGQEELSEPGAAARQARKSKQNAPSA